MRKIPCLLLAAVMAAALGACGIRPADVNSEPSAQGTHGIVTINAEGMGQIAYARTEAELDFEESYYTSASFQLPEPGSYVLGARTREPGWSFLQWTKDGNAYSADPILPVELTEGADFVAVFAFTEDGQNPVMNFVGEYQSGRAHALVECVGDDGAKITIDWGGSAWELARWEIIGALDTDTLTVEYSGASKSILTYDKDGNLVSQAPEYDDGSGTVVFHEDGTFTWHEDQADDREDMLFEWAPREDPGEEIAAANS